jgi:dual specificity phosphatase 12
MSISWQLLFFAPLLLTNISLARDQIWVNPGFHEQLVLFELCRYAPSRSEGIYTNWRAQLDRRLPTTD